MKRKTFYYVLMMVSVGLLILSVTLLNHTKFIAPIMIVISIYLFVGALIKLAKTNDKLKSTILCALDLLFWLP